MLREFYDAGGVVCVYGNRRRKIKDFINRLEPILDPPVKPEDDEERGIQSCCFVEKIKYGQEEFHSAQCKVQKKEKMDPRLRGDDRSTASTTTIL